MNKHKEKREYLHAHKKLAYIGSFSTNMDFFSKNAFFFFSNFTALINYFYLEKNLLGFTLLKYLLKNIFYFIKSLKDENKIKIIFYKFFQIIIKGIFFTNLYLQRLKLKLFNILILKYILKNFSTKLLKVYRYPIFILELFFTVLRTKESDKLKSIYESSKVMFTEKRIDPSTIRNQYYKLLLSILGKTKKRLPSEDRLEICTNRLRNQVVTNLFTFSTQEILSKELIYTINLQNLQKI